MGNYLQNTTRERRLRIRRGEAIRECGLDFFPITMDRYEEFVRYKDALLIRQSSLPVRYVSLDYFSAVFALEMDAVKNAAPGGLFYAFMRFLGLSLRSEITAKSMNDMIHFVVAGGEPKIEYIEFSQTDADGNPNTASLTPFQISSQIRPLIAAQNQIVLPDEAENTDLIEAYEKKKEIQSKGAALNIDLDDLVSSVAYLSGISDAEIMNWNVRDFENRRRAIERVLKYKLYAQAEMSGAVTFKNGNPNPSWCFDAVDETLGTMAAADLARTLSGAAAPGAAG